MLALTLKSNLQVQLKDPKASRDWQIGGKHQTRFAMGENGKNVFYYRQ